MSALIDEHMILAQSITDALQGNEDTELEVFHTQEGTVIVIDNVTFDFNECGKSEGLTISL